MNFISGKHHTKFHKRICINEKVIWHLPKSCYTRYNTLNDNVTLNILFLFDEACFHLWGNVIKQYMRYLSFENAH